MYTPLLLPDLKSRFARLSGTLDERFTGDLMAALTLID
jgi:hypothetical protein